MTPNLFPVTVTNHQERIEVATYAKENRFKVEKNLLDPSFDYGYPCPLEIRNKELIWGNTSGVPMDFSDFKSRIQPVLFQVECVNEEYASNLITRGNSYPVLEEDDSRYKIIDDRGNSNLWFSQSRFKRLNESKPDFSKIAVAVKDKNEANEAIRIIEAHGAKHHARVTEHTMFSPHGYLTVSEEDDVMKQNVCVWTTSHIGKIKITFSDFMSKYGGRKEEVKPIGYKHGYARWDRISSTRWAKGDVYEYKIEDGLYYFRTNKDVWSNGYPESAGFILLPDKEEAVTGYRHKASGTLITDLSKNVLGIIGKVDGNSIVIQDWMLVDYDPIYQPESIKLGSKNREFRRMDGRKELKSCDGTWMDVNRVGDYMRGMRAFEADPFVETIDVHGEIFTRDDYNKLKNL